ncbi:MAG: phosphoribosylglycinamide formyltransferase [Pseudomonadota bacterium]|nr:phosphoribosylglycinamide formyltransferase [Pseudomonadota bacterium]
MIRIAVLASGHGSNLQALIDACQSGQIRGDIVGVISNQPDAHALVRAEKAGLRYCLIDHRHFEDRASFENELIQTLQSWQVDLIVLAGFMRVLTANFVTRYSGQILNIHPSLLPAYKGLHTHQRVLDSGDQLHGCSVHFVTPELDAGAVIAQSIHLIEPHETLDSLKLAVHRLEHQLYPRIIGWIAAGRVAFLGNQVYLDGALMSHPIRFWQHG